MQTLCVDKKGMEDHVKHGDTKGRCGTTAGTMQALSNATIIAEEQTATTGVYPNPSRGQFTMQAGAALHGKALVTVTDSKGTVVETRSIMLTGTAQTLHFDLQGKPAGLYLVQVSSATGVQTAKVMVQK
jgi:hypothetical protein